MSGSKSSLAYAPPETPVEPQPEPASTETAEEHGGLKQLTEEQIRTWTLEQKDRWWLKNVYRGNMPQLTLRSALTGMVLGGVLSLTNLYVGAKTGWTLGVGITSVILSFALFKILSGLNISKEMTLLENNAMQSIATSAGYMTGPLITSVPAYMMVTNSEIPTWMIIVWITCLSILGVLFAFPLKKRFINDEQLPFPEGQAAGVVMDALHTGDAQSGLFKAKLLLATAGGSAMIALMKSEAIMERIKLKFLLIPEYLDGWLYKYVTPAIMGTPLKAITIRPETDAVMVAAGGLMGIRTGISIMVGACINYFILVPWMIQRGDIVGKVRDGVMTYGIKDITFWSLWGGVAMMTSASLFSFFSKPQVLISAFQGLMKKKGAKQEDILKDIELPMPVFAIGIPVMGTVVALLAHSFFGVKIWMGLLAVPLVFVFTLIAVTSTGLTSITPTGALGKLTQLTFSAIAPGNVSTNLMTAGITAEVSGNASNLLMDIKPGYMLGGKPRHQAIGHILGVLAGGICSVFVFKLLFLKNGPSGIISEQFPMPGVVQWKAVAEVLTKGIHNLKPSAQLAALIGIVAGIALETTKMLTKGKFWLSAVGIGLAFVLPFSNCLTMFAGAVIVWAAEKLFTNKKSLAHQALVENAEASCAGVIAGGALMGIAVAIIEIKLG